MRVLLVEDEVKLSNALVRALKLHGHVVDTIDDGSQALTRISLRHQRYDLVILDLTLPSLDGREVCRQARAREVTTPILVLTARGEAEIKSEVLRAGANDYLVKPFSLADLITRVHAFGAQFPSVVQ